MSEPARKQDDDGFAVFYDRWVDHVVRWIRALGGPPADRDDLVQEVFIAARRSYHRFDGEKPAAWLYQIARRQVRDHRRGAWWRRVTKGPSVAMDELPAVGDPEGAAELGQRRRVLAEILRDLGDKHRQVLVLFEIEGYSGPEIADILDVPIKTVWTRLHYARKAFFERVARYHGGR